MRAALSAPILIERLPLVTYVLEPAAPSRMLFVSPQVERLFGYAPAEFEADDGLWLAAIVADDRPRVSAALETLRRTHDEMSVTYRVVAADGSEVAVRDTAVVERGDDGEPYIQGFLTDITRERVLEQELAEERAGADAFFRDSAVGMGITDAEGRYVRVNDSLAQLLAVSVDDCIGRTLAEIAPALAAKLGDVYERVRVSGEPLRQHELEVELGGEQRVHVVSYFPIATRREPRYGRVVVDITGQRRAEERYRELIEQLPLVTYINALTPERRVVYVSPQVEELYGYPAVRWLAEPSLADGVVHPDDLDRVLAVEQAARRRREHFELEYRIVRADGSVRWVLDLMDTVHDEQGRPLFEQGFVIDVTERHESQRLFRAMFESALESTVITDDDGCFVDANEAACELFGRTREQLLGLRVGDVSPTPTDAAAIWESLLERGEASGSYVIARPGGELRDIDFAAKANVVPGRHLCVARDVTERKRLEGELWRAQRLETVGRLAGGVAHDFNNVLTTIRGHAQLLLGRSPDGTLERHHAEEIERAAERAAALTAQLLAFGRRQALQPRPLDLNELVRAHEQSIRCLAKAELELALADDLRCVRVDPDQIEQVLMNLVANAADATPPDGRIVVRTANADGERIDELGTGRYVVLSVEDSGAGIDESTREHLFEPFFTTKAVGDGSGLGLATAYGIVRQSGGTIAVGTTPGGGATFSVYLPEAATAPDAPTEGAGERVLVIEPDPALRDVVFAHLRDAGYRPLAVRSTAEAMRLAAGAEFVVDLLVAPFGARRTAAIAGALGIPRWLAAGTAYAPQRLLAAVRDALAVPRTGDAGRRFG